MENATPPSSGVPLISPPGSQAEKLLEPPRRHKKYWLWVSAVLILVLILLVALLSRKPEFSFIPEYQEIYSLIDDKVSASAAIRVRLPEGVLKTEQGISFEPEIKGKWISTNIDNVAVFKPDRSLEIGKHYNVSLVTKSVNIKKDFLADEDPAIVDLFPKPGTEADESSAITIVFNRPMVPLTTLGELDQKEIPVTITPPTEGKFKWISTRSLQFIPSAYLARSADYKVSVGAIRSVDGLVTAQKEFNFHTRALRLENSTQGSINYNQPIEFRFNMPVDLERTRSAIILRTAGGISVPFTVKYGSRIVYENDSSKSVKLEDRSVIRVYPSSDKFGRSGFWDFNSSYLATLTKAYPLGGGNIILSGQFNSNVTSTGIIKNVSVSSDRTNLASSNLFDPQGKVTISFYEDIDLNRSSIAVKGLAGIKYGEKCEQINGENYWHSSCKLSEDRSTIILSFDPQLFTSPGESVPIRLMKIVNSDGFAIGAEELVLPLTVYPALKILNIAPDNGVKEGSITDLYVCTNSPLSAKTGEDFGKAVKANDYIVLGRWHGAYIRTNEPYFQDPCSPGQYVNQIKYGLLPKKDYKLTLDLEDVFGQKVAREISFRTQSAPKFYLRFQSLQPQYNVTTPDHTKLTYGTENFDVVRLHICKVSPGTMVKYLSKRPSPLTPGENLDCIDSKVDVLTMPPRLWVNNYFQVDVANYFEDPRGQFILSFTHPDYTDYQGRQLYDKTYLSVTNLAVGEKRVRWTKYDTLPNITETSVNSTDAKGELYWVSRINSLEPVVGAKITVYHDTGYAGQSPEPGGSAVTGANGVAILPLIQDVIGTTVESETESAVVSAWADNLNWTSSASGGNRVYIYTDRPIYRPGQEVNVKGLYRLGFDGIYEIAQRSVEIKIIDSKGNTIVDKNLPISKFGTFNTSFKLPAEASLGYYSITALDHYSSFRVEEYVGAAFEATAKTVKDEYIAGEKVEIGVSGKYYFGVPLSGGQVDYSFTAQNYYFDKYQDEYFNFGGGWYNCYDCGYGDSFIKSGQAALDQNGELKLSEVLDFSSLFKDTNRDHSKIIVFHATVRDKEGRSVSTEQSFIVHRGEFYLGVKADPSFSGVDRPLNLRIKTVDTSGKSVKVSGIKIVISKVEWKPFKRQEVDGNYYYRYDRLLSPVVTKTVSTDSRGDYKENITLKEAGEYEIEAIGTDSRGNSVKSKSSLYIYGNSSVRPTNNATLDIQSEKTNVDVGDMARIIFQSPYERAKALVTLERGRIFDYKILDVNQNFFGYDFSVTPDFVPNVYASVLLLSPDPEIKFGQVQFNVGQKTKELNIEVKTDKKFYLPGEKVGLQIMTTDSAGKRVPAEISVSVADLSVLALTGNQKKNPVMFFYSGYPLSVTTSANIKNILSEVPIPTGTKGGGGGDAEDLAKRQRGEFKDTAFWRADVLTDANGSAHVSFDLPDNLTRWQIESLGITEDTKVGVKYEEITSKKEIMLTPLRPRFVVPGDEFEIGAKVFNQTASPQSLSVSFKSPTLPLKEGKAEQKIVLDSGESLTLYFKVKAPESQISGAHSFVLSAKNNQYDDTVLNEIPVNQSVTYEAVATANSTSANSAKEYIFLPQGVLSERGGLTLKTSATLAVFLSDALKYLVQYPYTCTEQLSSTLSGIAILKKGLALENVGDKFALPKIKFGGQEYVADDFVHIGLARIYDSRNADGGFTYYTGMKSDLFLTVNVLNALVDIKEAGYNVDTNVLASASRYIVKEQAKEIGYKADPYRMDRMIGTAYAIVRSGHLTDMSAITAYIFSNVDRAYLTDKASSQSLAYLTLLSGLGIYSADFTEKTFDALLNRVDIDSRGSYVKTNSSDINWQYYETPIKDTALLVKVLSTGRREYSQTDKLMRWLLSSRSADGAWGSTQNTLTVIDAFTEYLEWKRETESDFSLKVDLDGATLGEFDFNKNTVLDIFEKVVPISDLKPNVLQTILFERNSRNNLDNVFYYDIGLKYYLPAEKIAPRDEGVTIRRSLFNLLDTKEEMPLSSAKVGEVVKGQLIIISGKPRHLFAIEDFIPAGFELVNFSLETEDSTDILKPRNGVVGNEDTSIPIAGTTDLAVPSVWSRLFNLSRGNVASVSSSLKYADEYDRKIFRNKLYPDFSEIRDDRLFLFKQELPAGEFIYEYYLRATTPGTFKHLPAIASEMYYPENFGRTGGSLFQVTH